MNKMQMAHEYMLETIKFSGYRRMHMMQGVVDAWKYADAMQAEADKRENKERPKVFEEDPFKALYPFIDWRNHGRGLYHFWAMDEDGRAFWHNREPKINGGNGILIINTKPLYSTIKATGKTHYGSDQNENSINRFLYELWRLYDCNAISRKSMRSRTNDIS